MKSLIIYDSVYGNTEKIAQAVAAGLGPAEDVSALRASVAKPEQLRGMDLVVVGAPTQAFRPTKPVQEFLASLSGDALRGVGVAAFDTRVGGKDTSTPLRILVKAGGFAAPKIAAVLKKKGGELTVPPEGFLVKSQKVPVLAEGEMERAAAWAQEILAAQKVKASKK